MAKEPEHFGEVIFKSKDEKKVTVQWNGRTGHGQLNFTYNEKGGWTVDAEFIAFDTMIEIIKNTDFTKVV